MGYIPEDAHWYLADLVEEVTVEGDPRNVVHTNMILIRADSPEEAYEKSMELGKSSEISYPNSAGRQVTIKFRGLHQLNVIHDQLEHGAELTYDEDIGMSEDEISRWLSPKEELGVFAPRLWSPSSGPDYAAGEIMTELRERFPDLEEFQPGNPKSSDKVN
ncbi:MAG TPA: DUF4288 domain-containing protein [Terriglobia bacterium]|nr:DUF4288 domain-containing protein [Terriglobia bacterium]